MCLEAAFEHRLPRPDDSVKIGMVDLADADRWIELGISCAWIWQQGCRLQWRPASDREVFWNDREGDRFVCRVLDVRTRKLPTLPRAIGRLNPDGKAPPSAKITAASGISALGRAPSPQRAAGIPDPSAGQPAPAEVGVWQMDIESGETRLLVSVADLVKLSYPGQSPADRHHINHLSWSPDGRRFLMFNCWSGRGQPTRVFTMTRTCIICRAVGLCCWAGPGARGSIAANGAATCIRASAATASRSSLSHRKAATDASNTLSTSVPFWRRWHPRV